MTEMTEAIDKAVDNVLQVLRKAHGELGHAFALLFEITGQETGELSTILDLRRDLDELILRLADIVAEK